MKRKRSNTTISKSPKKQKLEPPTVQHPVLHRFYPSVLTLRQYCLSRIPLTSKKRRRQLELLGRHGDAGPVAGATTVDTDLCELLDKTLVGVCKDDNNGDRTEEHDRAEQLLRFSQQVTSGSDITVTAVQPLSQAEVSR